MCVRTGSVEAVRSMVVNWSGNPFRHGPPPLIPTTVRDYFHYAFLAPQQFSLQR
jgi:hypothetical protein